MLSARTLIDRDGIILADVSGAHGAGRGTDEPARTSHGLVFVRRGCFVRTVEGRTWVLDPTLAYGANPGEEERIDHPHDHGDDCTWLRLDADLAAALYGGDPGLPARSLPTAPRVDLEHRRLLAAAGRDGSDEHALVERAIGLAAAALERDAPARVASGRLATERARRAVVEQAREALAADPTQSLPELGRRLAVSPHHLSRVFRALTGATVSRHRMSLRVRAVLERLGGGERDLARLAADADQAHLCRVVRAETGTTPSALREALA
ncbi:MAG TPA: AraC family transcriptional regulator [Solirubrobacteraceae bacterium]|nr:AraC family transcriptional regulator [Solirubrobacteraceae bacterium]